jgi:flagellar basal-body rod protein FlgF
MINGVFSTFSGKTAAERRLEILANNMANALTPGFKASRPVYNGSTMDGDVGPDQLQQTYVNIPDTYVHFSDGPLIATGNTLDLAINGSGFFVVSTPNGDMYTRDGQFTLSADKKLVTMDGYPVTGQNGGEITVEGKDVKIEADGSIYTDGTRLDRIKVVDFEDKTSLKNVGSSLFVNGSTTNNETTPGNYSIKQGYYEASNVDVMKEMVDMISSMRAYEAYSKADQAVDESLGRLIDTVKL